jgi:hypothetical protein
MRASKEGSSRYDISRTYYLTNGLAVLYPVMWSTEWNMEFIRAPSRICEKSVRRSESREKMCRGTHTKLVPPTMASSETGPPQPSEGSTAGITNVIRRTTNPVIAVSEAPEKRSKSSIRNR